VRSGGGFGQRTRQATRSGRGMDASADERSKVRGGAARGGSVRKKRRRGRNGRDGVGRRPFEAEAG
jgi:hypothetical protein